MTDAVTCQCSAEDLLQDVEGQVVVVHNSPYRLLRAAYEVYQVEIKQFVSVHRRVAVRAIGKNKVIWPVGDLLQISLE